MSNQSNQEGPMAQSHGKGQIIAHSHYSWRDKHVGGELKKPVLFGKQ